MDYDYKLNWLQIEAGFKLNYSFELKVWVTDQLTF